VQSAIERNGLDPATLRIEITESVLLGDTSVADSIFHDLKALGVELAIDDFGTGYSSFGYLRRLPADIIKVDRSFISSIDRDEREISIVRAVVAVADALGMGVTVEGIEREEQAAIMTEMGATHAQGYLFSPPRRAEEAEAYTRERSEGRSAA
jgi:EAL domain-containing protein (putative c-di-GMP-specific phosphodiesterase class I)